RPLAPDELEELVTLSQQATDFETGLKIGIRAVISSPSFLYRAIDNPQPDAPTVVHDLSPYEVATRLSYFLWGTMPDDELWSHAQRGDLTSPDVMRAEVGRMVADERAIDLLQNLLGDWYHLDALSTHAADPAYPELTPELQDDMATETKMFF